MENQLTCGQGLAAHSELPAKLGELTVSVAENLEVHTKALDSTDENSKKELDAYLELANEHRKIATRLKAAAEHMAGYRHLPMGRHDQKVMSGPEVLGAFEKFVKLELELLALLQKKVEQDRKMLIEMGEAGGGVGVGERRLSR
jgi:hypothetical protein